MDYQRCNRSLDSLLSTCLPQLPDPGNIMPTGQIPHFLALSSRLTGLPRWLTDKESSCQCRRHEKHRFCPWVAKIPWKRNANPLQNSCLRNPTDRGAGWDTVCGAAKSRTRLNTSRVIMILPEKSYRQRSRVGYSLWGSKESDTTEHIQGHYDLAIALCF